MSVLVDTVRISNFRSLRNVEVSLSRVTLLVGMNNSGKTSFLKAINLALGADRRIATADDFFVGTEGELSRQNTKQIVIDVRIIPANDMETRVDEFDDSWINTEFGGDLINFDEDGRQYVAVRIRVEFDPLRNDYVIQRVSLNDWQMFDNWLNTPKAIQKGGNPKGVKFAFSFLGSALSFLIGQDYRWDKFLFRFDI